MGIRREWQGRGGGEVAYSDPGRKIPQFYGTETGDAQVGE